MENNIKRIWIVENKFYRVNPQSNCRENERTTCEYFSSEEKAMLHIEWIKECAKNNGMKQVYDNLNGGNMFRNGNNIVDISLYKRILDPDDLMIGEA